MKIAAVRAHLVNTPIPEKHRVESGAGFKFNRQMCLVEIVTDEGISGIGSPSGPYDLGVLGRIVENVLGPHLIGRDPADIVHLWHLMFHGEVSRNLGHHSIGVAAMSGVDTALWDIKGKIAGRPLYDLLGGRYHLEGARAYASSIYWDRSPEAAASEAQALNEQGFTAVKLKVGRSLERDIANLAAIRSAIGDTCALMVDANQSLDRVEANRLLALLEDKGCYWFEEPLPIDDVQGLRDLRKRRDTVRIATGENLYARYVFAELARRGAADVLQADAARAGGITEARAVSELASAHHIEWHPHTFNDIVTVVANLHLIVASPHPALLEWDITHNDLMTHLADLRLELDSAGRVLPPTAPGLGLQIDWDFVAAHPWNGEPSVGSGSGLRA